MKIAFVCNNFKSLNGVERIWSLKLSHLAESGDYDVYLITYNQYGAPFSFPISDKVHYMDLATRYISKCSFHGCYQYIDRYLSEITFRKELNEVLKVILPDIIVCADLNVAELKAILYSTVKAKRIVECHCGRSAYFADIAKYPSFSQRIKQFILKNKMIHLIPKFDKIVVLTESEIQDWNLGDKVVLIPNMLAEYPEHINKSGQTHRQVISVGRYAYQKGYDMLLDAWIIVQNRHPDWTLHIYGSHDGGVGDYEHLKKTIEANQIDNIFLHQASNDVYSCYRDSDFYVMSSRFESFGMVLIEAMSCGLPVISFDCKYGPRSIVTNDVTGILVPPNNVEKMAEAICSMIENDNNRLQIATNARIESKKYRLNEVMPLWYEFYRSLEKGRPTDA